jgi:hypothetical protein
MNVVAKRLKNLELLTGRKAVIKRNRYVIAVDLKVYTHHK